MASVLLGVQLFAAGLAGAVAWRAFRQRSAPGARPFGVAMAAVAVWALLSALLQHPLFQGPVAFSLLLRAKWIPIGAVGVTWLAFGLAYTGRTEHLTRRRFAALSVVPALTAVTAFCHGILLEALEPVVGSAVVDPLFAVAEVWPTIQAVGAGYTYLLVVVGSLLLLEVLVERPFPHPGQALMVLVVGPPLALNVAQVTVLQIQEFDPTILGFAISGLAGLAAVGRFRLFDVPLARARVVETLDSGVLVYGQDGAVYDYNERAAALLSLPADVTGTDIRAVLADSPLAVDIPVGPHTEPVTSDEAASDGDVPALGAYLDGQTVAVKGEDDPAYVELRLSELADVAGDPLSRVVLLYDVSERERRKRDLERKNEFLDEFASVVSHDVATPLGVIENKAHLVEVTGDPAHAADIYDATDRVQALVDELRDLAREGVQVGETTPVALGEVAHEAWDAVETEGATLTVTSTRTVEADRGRLRQLFENLFDNAVTHGAPDRRPRAGRERAAYDTDGGGAVVVEVGTHSEGFYVADDGPGIPEGEREQVFEQGYTTTESGSGLGLAIVQRVVDGHGWSIVVTEGDSGGARFEVDT
jgi:signal transduction histidine kinase